MADIFKWLADLNFKGPGKSTAPLSAMYSPLLPAAVHPNDYVSSVGVMLVCYQQVGVVESTLALAESGAVDLP